MIPPNHISVNIAFPLGIGKKPTKELVELRLSEKESITKEKNDRSRIAVSTNLIEISTQDKLTSATSQTQSSTIGRRGREQHTVHFGSTRKVWEEMIDIITPRSVWLLLDEWSSVPIDLQPYLADLVRPILLENQ